MEPGRNVYWAVTADIITGSDIVAGFCSDPTLRPGHTLTAQGTLRPVPFLTDIVAGFRRDRPMYIAARFRCSSTTNIMTRLRHDRHYDRLPCDHTLQVGHTLNNIGAGSHVDEHCDRVVTARGILRPGSAMTQHSGQVSVTAQGTYRLGSTVTDIAAGFPLQL